MILHVISGLGVGGAEAMLVQVAGALQARGMLQHVVSLTGRGENAARLEARGVPVSSLELRSMQQAPAALLRLRRLIARERPTVVQGWMYHGNLLAALGHGLAPGRARRQLYWGLRASNMDAARYGRLNAICARLSHWPQIVIANSHAGVHAHLECGYRPRRIEVIGNGIDTGRFRPSPDLRREVRLELGLPHDAVVAIHVARIDPMKDHATFLAAMAKTSNVTALLAGAGTQELAHLPKVRALGLRHDIERLYPAADLVVSSSAFGEGFSNSVAEGMSAGLIPIATDVGDARAIVGEAGFIVPVGDADALAAAIDAVASMAPDERLRHGLAARAHVEGNFTIEMAIEAFARLYDHAPSS